MNGSGGMFSRASVRAKAWLRSRSGARLDMGSMLVHAPVGDERQDCPASSVFCLWSACLMSGRALRPRLGIRLAALVGGAIGGGRGPGVARQVQTQVRGAAQAGTGRDV